MSTSAGHNEHATAFATGANAAVALPRVLVIEDEADLAQLLKLHLRDAHASVACCSRVSEGMRRAFAEEWSLVVLDLSLPDGDGLEICARLRRRDRYFHRRDPAAEPGTGLGLAIVRRIVELHGGRVSMTSAPGARTTVTFHLPLASASDGARRAATRQEAAQRAL